MEDDCKILLVKCWNLDDVSVVTLKKIIRVTNPINNIDSLKKNELIEYIKEKVLTYERCAVIAYDILIEDSNCNTISKKRCYKRN